MMDKFSKALWNNPSNVSAGLEEAHINFDDPKTFACSLMTFERDDGQDRNRIYASRDELIDPKKPDDINYDIADEFFNELVGDDDSEANEEDDVYNAIERRSREEIVWDYTIRNHTNVYTVAAPYLKYDTLCFEDMEFNWRAIEKAHFYESLDEMTQHIIEDVAALKNLIPNALSETIKNQYDNAHEAIFDISSDGYLYATVYSNDYKVYYHYSLEDIIKCLETGEIEFVSQDDYILPLRRITGRRWHFHFTTEKPSIPHKLGIDIESETGIEYNDPQERRKIVLEGKGFRNAALGLATAAGLFGSYNNITTKPDLTPIEIVAKQNKDEKRPLILTRNKPNIPHSDLVSVEAFPERHLIKYKNRAGQVVNSRGFGTLASRANNPGNLVVNDLASARKIGAIGYSTGNYNNKYAVFATPEAGEYALIAWWEKNSDKSTVRDMLGRFAPRSQNDLKKYENFLEGRGVPMDLLVAQLTDEEFDALIEGIKTWEGYYAKPAKDISKYNTQ